MTLEQALACIAELEETIRQLKSERGDEIFFINELPVSKHGLTLLRLFLSRRIVTRQLMLEAMYEDRASGGPDFAEKVIHTVVYRLRKKLSPFDISLKTIRSVGYEIGEADQAKLRALVKRSDT
jgi:DNA-binding response OmpR family regulator